MERIQRQQMPNDGHIGLPIEEEVRAIVAKGKRQGRSIRSMHRQMIESAPIADSLSRLFTQYDVKADADPDDTKTT